MSEIVVGTIKDLKEKGMYYMDSLDVKNQRTGFHILHGNQEQYLSFLQQWVTHNGIEHSYADFYGSHIRGEARDIIFSHCTCEQRKTLESLLHVQQDEEFIFVQLSPSIIDCLLAISYQELLFSSFYFTKEVSTIWSNYEGKFLCFTKEEKVQKKILKLAEKCGIYME